MRAKYSGATVRATVLHKEKVSHMTERAIENKARKRKIKEREMEDLKVSGTEIQERPHEPHPHPSDSHPHAAISRRRRYIAVTVVLLAIAVVAAVWQRAGRPNQRARAETSNTANAALAPPDVIEATDEQMKQIVIESVSERTIDLDRETTGKVGFNEDRMTPIFAPYAGRVVEVLANKGAVVTSGQPLLVVESPDLVAALNDLAGARADEDKTKIALDAAEQIAERARSLYLREALATKELQAAETDLARSREEYRRAQAGTTVVKNRLAMFGKDKQEIAQFEKVVNEQIDRRIVIRAPISGTIVERKVGPGQYIKPDAPDPLYLITDLSTLWVMADVYESYLPQIRVGAPVEITPAAYPDRRLPAHISFINPTVDAATRTIRVRCLVPNPAGVLKPEMFAKIKIGAAIKQNVPIVPSSAIITQGPDTFVLIEESARAFRRRQVKTGREMGNETVIEAGLRAGERVITQGVLLLNNGLKPADKKG